MSEVKRFKPVINDKPYKPYAHCEESEDGIYVRLADYAELKAQRDALAADREKFAVQCAAAKIAVQYAQAAGFECTLNTPAVDAYLNSVRADAIESVVDALTSSGALTVGDSIVEVVKLAESIRAGEPS